eukprot:scaffold85309_cov63-Phaeocystis_antarctica.AAC.4
MTLASSGAQEAARTEGGACGRVAVRSAWRPGRGSCAGVRALNTSRSGVSMQTNRCAGVAGVRAGGGAPRDRGRRHAGHQRRGDREERKDDDTEQHLGSRGSREDFIVADGRRGGTKGAVTLDIAHFRRWSSRSGRVVVGIFIDGHIQDRNLAAPRHRQARCSYYGIVSQAAAQKLLIDIRSLSLAPQEFTKPVKGGL